MLLRPSTQPMLFQGHTAAPKLAGEEQRRRVRLRVALYALHGRAYRAPARTRAPFLPYAAGAVIKAPAYTAACPQDILRCPFTDGATRCHTAASRGCSIPPQVRVCIGRYKNWEGQLGKSSEWRAKAGPNTGSLRD